VAEIADFPYSLFAIRYSRALNIET